MAPPTMAHGGQVQRPPRAGTGAGRGTGDPWKAVSWRPGMEDEARPVPPLGGEATGDWTNVWWRDGGKGHLQWVRSEWQDRTATWKRVTKSERLDPMTRQSPPWVRAQEN